MTITEFLLARIAEDEAAARAADVKQGDPAWKVCEVALSHPLAKRVRSARDNRPVAYIEDVAGDDEADETGILDGEAAAAHIARHDPARVLAECQAKRRIVEMLAARDEQDHPAMAAHATGLRLAVKALATIYADNPDYDEAWRP